MAYEGLGSRQVTAALDETGNNTGNYTAVFDPSVLAIDVPWFELYRGVVQDAVPGAQVTVYVDKRPVSAAPLPQVAEWDPSQPVLLEPGSTIYFYFSTPLNAIPTPPAPEVTLWFRFDAAMWSNS